MKNLWKIRYCLVCIVAISPARVLAAEPVVAIHVSETSAQFWAYDTWKSFHPVQFLEEALTSDGTPFIELSDADIDAGELLTATGAPRYPILFSLATEVISDTQASQIRTFVEEGGYAYVGSSSWTRNTNGTLRVDNVGKPVFALGTEMGLSPGSWMRMASVTKVIDDPMISHLPFGVSEWQMPRVYSFLDLWTPHWVWAAFPSGSSPATPLLTTTLDAKFQSSFGNPPEISQAPNIGLGLADVNGDGRTDLVFRAESTVFVRLSSGQGLKPAVVWSSWNSAYSMEIADVDGDGMADIVGRLNSGNDVQVGLSTGAAFSPSAQWTTWNPMYTMNFADVDGDGNADIVGRLNSGNDVQVGLSTGLAFSPSTQWTTWNPMYTMDFADVDGDGDADIVGRLNNGNDVQVGLSNGTGGGKTFAAATQWTTWGPAYTMSFGDVDGDGDADIVGRGIGGSDVQVGLSDGEAGGARFASATQWAMWSPDFTIDLADINGDRRFDLLGVKVRSGAGSLFPMGDVQIGLSGGPAASTSVKLAIKRYGAGTFIYNSEIVPLAGYGGFSNDNSEYKTIRTSIVQAFNLSARMPLVTLAPWPFPRQAALIYRHDHALAADVHQLEVQLGGASATRRFGEYYLMPELAGQTFQWCNEPNDYPSQTSSIVATGGMIGAHVINHVNLDDWSYADALLNLQQTTARIQSETGNKMLPIFVAPVYRAVKLSSIRAIWDAGFLTTGEQGTGPFPHFSFNPQGKGRTVGTLLQLPVSEWPGYDNMERMSIDPTIINKAVALSYELGGLINVYDHLGHDPYAGVCTTTPTMRAGLAQRYLNDALGRPGVWVSNSLEIRDWWLQRDTRTIDSTITSPTSTSLAIDVAVQSRRRRAYTPFPIKSLGLRISLDAASQAMRDSRVSVIIDGVLQPGITCQTNARVRCIGGDLLVRIGAARLVRIWLGNQGALYGDFSDDGDVDLEDYSALYSCAGSSGVGEAAPPLCDSFRWDDDTDVDLREIAAFQNVFTGPEVSRVCGNGAVESSEECNGWPGCSANCQTGGVVNDRCQAAIAVGDGTRTYSNLGATTDGPDEPTMCDFFGLTSVDSDIWYCYTATCTGTALASLCGSDYDTKLAVYAGCACPTSPPLACSDDDCGADVENYQSRVTFAATAGQTYLVRVGGYYGEQGYGQMTIGCNVDACGNGGGDCFSASPTEAAGCGDATCCAATCQFDEFCCDVTWNTFCAGLAQGVCTGSFTACAPQTGECDVQDDSAPGCENVACCNTVCMVDPHCCLTAWDADCAQEAQSMCFLTCGLGAGDCFSAHQTPGCDLVTCCEAVCTQDLFCCVTEWDPLCVDLAATACP